VRTLSRLLLSLMLLSTAMKLTDLAAQQSTDGLVVTLEEARRRAVSVDPAAVAARSQTGSAAWARRAAQLDFLTPNVTVGTSFIHYSDPFFNFGTGDVSANAASATLEARYTLLGAGKLGALNSTAASLASAEANESAAEFRTTFATDAAYYAVLADRELSRVASDRLARAKEQFEVARARVLAGEAISADSLQLLLEMNRARLGVLQRDSALTVSMLALGRQIGVTEPVDAAPIDTTTLGPLPMSLAGATSEMLASGPDVVAVRAAERGTDAVLHAERENYLPAITVGFTTGAYDSKFFPSVLRRSQVTLGVTWPIWDAGRREAAVARARAEADIAQAKREDTERATWERMAAAYSGYETARAGIELAEVGVAVSSETYRVQSARYREGATTILDLLEAQVNLSEAQVMLVQARYAVRLALAEIEALLGRRIDD
jgi:outer membrane protein TolC